MKIAIIATELSPFSDQTTNATEAACLAGAFLSLGHDVRVIIPLPNDIDLNVHALARRLTRITFQIGGVEHSCARYDGRTSSGVTVHLLEIAEGSSVSDQAPDQEAFCHASTAFLRSLNEPIDWCFSWGHETSLVASLAAESTTSTARMSHFLFLPSIKDSDPMPEVVSAADRVVVFDGNVLERAVQLQNEQLIESLASGRITALARPITCGEPRTFSDKVSAKAAFQLRNDLPVRTDVPLVLFMDIENDTNDHALRSFIRGDVQAVCPKGDVDLTKLAERYPDRLSLIPFDSYDDALLAADACVLGKRSHLAMNALSNGTVPIVRAAGAGGIVDLEPSCESGSAIVVDDSSEKSLEEGLGRFVSAFRNGPVYRSLVTRLPGYVVSWSDAAQHYLQLMEEAKPTGEQAP